MVACEFTDVLLMVLGTLTFTWVGLFWVFVFVFCGVYGGCDFDFGCLFVFGCLGYCGCVVWFGWGSGWWFVSCGVFAGLICCGVACCSLAFWWIVVVWRYACLWLLFVVC